MLTVNKLIAQGQGLAAALLKRAGTVELDWDVRQKSRFDATDSQGRLLGVFLPRGTVVRGGDVLVADDGSFIRAIAAPPCPSRTMAMETIRGPAAPSPWITRPIRIIGKLVAIMQINPPIA